jgi:hypothetical protein
VEAAQVAHGSPDYLRFARRAKLSVVFEPRIHGLEGVVAVVAGSITLIGFGIDSAI